MRAAQSELAGMTALYELPDESLCSALCADLTTPGNSHRPSSAVKGGSLPDSVWIASISRLNCRLGDLRRLNDRDLSLLLGLTPQGVQRIRKLLGLQSSQSFHAIPADQIEDP